MNPPLHPAVANQTKHVLEDITTLARLSMERHHSAVETTRARPIEQQSEIA
jgi:hypothetical protein